MQFHWFGDWNHFILADYRQGEHIAVEFPRLLSNFQGYGILLGCLTKIGREDAILTNLPNKLQVVLLDGCSAAVVSSLVL